MTRCKYCTEDFDGFKTVLDKNGHAMLSERFPNKEPVLWIRVFGKQWEVPINFCPMCGRRLSKDAGSKTD